MNMPFFSLIVPVYNVENYLRQCLDSILHQDFTDFEIILVNDGSTDNSPIICEDYVKKDSRVKLICQKNGGLSDARNTGIKHANGQYIWFIDSDDWIGENALFTLNSKLKLTNIEVFSFSFIMFYDNTKEYSKIVYNQAVKETTGNAFLSNIEKFHPAVWLYVYKTSFVKENNFNFEKDLIHEDVYFNLNCFFDIRRISKITEPLYFHRIRNGSIMRDYSNVNLQKRINSYIKILELCYRLKNKNELFINRNINLYKITLFEVLYEYTTRDINFKKKYDLLKEAKKVIHKMPVQGKTNLINIMKIIFNHSVSIFYLLRILTSKLYILKINKTQQ